MQCLDNVDYDELKHLIKERTSAAKSSPVSIPGQEDDGERWSSLEDELFVYLYDQHERVNLFTKSKFGELERRINYLNKQLMQLKQQAEKTSQSRVPVQQTRRFQKLVEGTQDLGEEVQSLSRYANTQRIAFKKILKKYQKWTGSSKLSMRMNNEVFNRPTSFLRPDFTPLLDQLSDMQSSLRRISEHGVSKQISTSTSDENISDDTVRAPRSAAYLIGEAFRNGTGVEIDIALATVPLGAKGGRASYWIHPDNLDEVRVLLLRHLKEYSSSRYGSISRTNSRSSLGSRHGSISSEPSNTLVEPTNTVLFDELDAFLKDQNSTTLNYAEETPGSSASRVMMQTNWTKDSDYAFVATSDDISTHHEGSSLAPRVHDFKIHRIRRKDVDKILPTSATSSSVKGQLAGIREWIQQHSNIKPLANVSTLRSRFGRSSNDTVPSIWATLDQSIIMSSVSRSSLLGDDDSKQTRSDFPHAVLEIRWEQDRAPELVNTLNASYLAERVRGFSLQTHAIYTICCQQEATRPLWMSIIGKDIRKVPPKQGRSLLKRNLGSSGESSKATSISAPSTDSPTSAGLLSHALQSSATSAPNSAVESPVTSPMESKKRRKKLPALDISRNHQHSTPRYWNEFDDGSEVGDDDVYTIFVDPNAPSGFPGAETASKVAIAVRNAATASTRKLGLWLWPAPKEADPSEEPLLFGQTSHSSYSYDIEDSSDSDLISPLTPPRSHWPRTRSGRKPTPSTVQDRRQQSRELGFLRTYIGCFSVAYVLLVLSAILHATARRKATFEADIGIVVGVVASLFLGVVGLSMNLMRRDRISWFHRMAVLLAFTVNCVAGGILLAIMADAI